MIYSATELQCFQSSQEAIRERRRSHVSHIPTSTTARAETRGFYINRTGGHQLLAPIFRRYTLNSINFSLIAFIN